MRKYGFKLFSTNLKNNPTFVDDAVKFVQDNSSEMFIELMVIPSTEEKDFDILEQKFSGLEVTIHAPHNGMGFDTGYREKFQKNAEILGYAQRAADRFNSKVIVVHAGGGSRYANLVETAHQFRMFNDERIVVENLPYVADDVEDTMHGNTPEQIAMIMDYAKCGFCFDFSHALCAANSLNIDIYKQLEGFYKLNPTVYHMCDGKIDGIKDIHLHYGEGTFPLKEILEKYVADDAMITMETGHGMPVSARAWIDDFNYLHQLQQK